MIYDEAGRQRKVVIPEISLGSPILPEGIWEESFSAPFSPIDFSWENRHHVKHDLICMREALKNFLS